MKRNTTTKAQRKLIRDLEELWSLLSLDYTNITNYEKTSRTLHLERMKRHLIIGEVVVQYTLIDECLNIRLCKYFFGANMDSIRIWKTTKFQNFNYHVLEQLSLLEKLRFVRSFVKIPKSINGDIERINALRNGLVHALFPENLKKSKPIYKGKSIFSIEGINLFIEDMGKITAFFLHR